MAKITGPIGPRRNIALTLKQLREESGQTLTDVAGELMISTSKLSRLENAQGQPQRRDIRDLIRYYGIEETPLADQLWQWVAAAERPGWWTDYDDEMLGGLDAHLAYEADATVERVYTLPFVPALLQTAEYARAIFKIWSLAPRTGTSSHMFRDLIPLLADRYRVVAPDLPGFGNTVSPPRGQFDYTFDNLARVIGGFIETIGLRRYALYVFDYGAQTGTRLTVRPKPDDGFDLAEWQRLRGRSERRLEPDPGLLARRVTVQPRGTAPLLAPRRPSGNTCTEFPTRRRSLRTDTHSIISTWAVPARPSCSSTCSGFIRRNVALYPTFQNYFRTSRPPLLAVWGKNDPFFLPQGAEAFKRDLPDAVVHSSTPGISPWRRTPRRLRRPSATSFPADWPPRFALVASNEDVAAESRFRLAARTCASSQLCRCRPNFWSPSFRHAVTDIDRASAVALSSHSTLLGLHRGAGPKASHSQSSTAPRAWGRPSGSARTELRPR